MENHPSDKNDPTPPEAPPEVPTPIEPAHNWEPPRGLTFKLIAWLLLILLALCVVGILLGIFLHGR